MRYYLYKTKKKLLRLVDGMSVRTKINMIAIKRTTTIEVMRLHIVYLIKLSKLYKIKL